ncbi:MAG: N-acetyltransferase [Chitinophagaceae bacterium]|nr:MAG: N-acetyltransferase [Chitinophagaceae bacterium]
MSRILNIDSPKQNLRNVTVGNDVVIYDFVNAYDCVIGDGSKIGTFTEIQSAVSIGRNCKISSHSFICSGVEIRDRVFIGHGVMFINDLFPRAANADGQLQTASDWKVVPTIVMEGASIGSNATILAGITIGENAMVGAGSVVTKDVPANAVVAGNPARVVRQSK